MKEIYDFALGDFFESQKSTPGNGPCSFDFIYYAGYQADSIVSVSSIDSFHKQYICKHSEVENDFDTYYATTAHSSMYATDTLIYDTSLLFNHFSMPEESPTTNLYYFIPNNTSSIISPIYSVENTYYSDIHKMIFKQGFGKIYNEKYIFYDVGSECENYVMEYVDNTLIYSVKNGITCGTYYPLSIENLNKNTENKIEVFPNPATSILKINATEPIKTIAIFNFIGQTIFEALPNSETTELDVSKLPAGLYFIKINGTDVRKFIK